MSKLFPEIMSAADARKDLPSITERFRNQGAEAPPVFFGSHRKPEAVLMSMQRYEVIMSVLEDQLLGDLIQQRLSQSSKDVPLEDAIKKSGVTQEQIDAASVYVE